MCKEFDIRTDSGEYYANQHKTKVYLEDKKHLKYSILSHDFKHKADYKICLMFGLPDDT